MRWWGSDWCPLVACEVDLRVGGAWRYLSLDADGNELGWHGTFHEIEPPSRSVSTEVFEGVPAAESVNTMTLTESITEHGVLTTMQTLVRHATQEYRDRHIASGMEDGMQVTFNRLEDLLLELLDTTEERFRRVAARFTARVDEVPEDRPAPPRPAPPRPAPCQGRDARDIVRHMVEWIPSALSGAGLDFPPGPSVDVDAAGAWAHLSAWLQKLLDDPEVAAREFQMGPVGTQTVERAIGMAILGDVVIHTWDLARATGLDESLDGPIVREMLVGMQPMDEMLRQSGHHGPKVDVAEDADAQTRLLAFTGRTP